jgi:two-component system, cell cycle sensor histidine kinase and response regulator CckA
VNDGPPSSPRSTPPRKPLAPRPFGTSTDSLLLSEQKSDPAADPAAGKSPTEAKVAQPEHSAEDVAEIQQLREEIAECRESLELWTRAEAEWRDQRRLFKVMTENVTDLIVLIDATGNRVWNNPAYSHALGCTQEELAGSYVLAEVHPEDRSRAVEAFEKALKGSTQQAEYRVQQKSGGWLSLQTEIVPIRNPDGEIESLVLMAHDVTEVKKLTEALALSSNQGTAVGMVETMARDFDQILTNTFGNLAIARNLNGPHNAVAVRLSEIERSLQKARDLIEQMFTLSPNSEQPKTRMAFEGGLHEAVNSVLRGTMVRAEFNLARNLPELELDTEAFGHIVRNLVTNSLQSMDRGVIRFTAEIVPQKRLAEHPEIPLKPGDYICLVMQDQGHGMTEKVLAHAFEPYFTTRQGSQGLGLTTALSAVQRMGGTILLDSTPSVGTTTYVYFPAPAVVAKPARPGTMALPKVGEKKRILLMDDEQMILDIVSRMLTHLGYEVAICKDGAQAIAAFAKAKSAGQPFDVVLMDLVIPNGVGGQDAVHTIRKIDPTAKVIASSGHLEHPVMVDHKKFGFIAALEKPYKLERLQQVIEAVVDSSG